MTHCGAYHRRKVPGRPRSQAVRNLPPTLRTGVTQTGEGDYPAGTVLRTVVRIGGGEVAESPLKPQFPERLGEP